MPERSNERWAAPSGRPPVPSPQREDRANTSSHNAAGPAGARNAFGLHACSDCAAVVDGTDLRHDGSCPLGRDIDATMAADRDWFESHPGATERRRPLTWAERETLKAPSPVPEGATWRGNVVVYQVRPGIRLRSMAEVYATPRGVVA